MSERRDPFRLTVDEAGEARPYKKAGIKVTFHGRLVLVVRVTLSYAAGVLGAAFGISVLASLFGEANASDVPALVFLYVGMAFVVSWPLYLAAIVVAFVLGKSIAAQPAMWSAAAVVIVVGLSYWALPWDARVTDLYAIMPTALISGAFFWAWNAWFPVAE